MSVRELKIELKKYAPGSPEYTVLHGELSRRRGRNPSVTFQYIMNPRRALKYANLVLAVDEHFKWRESEAYYGDYYGGIS